MQRKCVSGLRPGRPFGWARTGTSKKKQTLFASAFGALKGIRTPDLLVRSAGKTVLVGKISCKTVPFGSVSAFWDDRDWEKSMVKKAFGGLMDGKNR